MLRITKASAGAGKTFLLTKTYIDMLFAARYARNAHRRILAVTFTKKATAEMKQRIVKELSKLARAKKSDFEDELKKTYNLTTTELQKHAKQILHDLLQDFGAFGVSTIDSFFQQVIRAFSRELNLSGKYNLELDTKTINQMAVDELFLNLKEEDKTTFKLLLDIVRENIANDKAWDPKDNLLQLSSELFKEEVMLHRTALFDYLKDTARVEAFQKKVNQTIQQYKAVYMQRVATIQQYLADNSLQRTDFSNGKNIFAPLDYPLSRIQDLNLSIANFRKFIMGETVQKDKMMATHQANLQPLMQPLYDMLTGKPLKQLLTATAIQQNLANLLLLGKIAEVIEQKNQQLNRLSISDTNMLLNDVIRANEVSPFIYEKLGTRIRHFLIDEFQDTSAMQWNSFRPLISESLATNQDNLIVGDVKQSIYRFRNSDYSLMFRQIANDFPQGKTDTLLGNWRSSKAVVDFNNQLFSLLPHTLDLEIEEVLDKRYPHLNNVLQEIFDGHLQQAMLAEKAAEGFVQIRFLAADKKEDWHKESLSHLPDLLADIKQRGFSLSRVACLIRNNKEAIPLANTLIAAGYKVVSNEGLLLTSSPTVQYIIYTLKKRIYPDDKIVDFYHNYYAQSIGLTDVQTDGLTDLFPFVSAIARSINISPAEQPYVTALLDEVYNYTNLYTSDIYSFLIWWDEHSEKLSLALQETADAIQIVSIHKSKGLEYDVVIVPFCDWEKSVKQGASNTILWVKGKDEKSPPILPITFKKSLNVSDYAEEYCEELMKLYLDNLNTTYVAFTRAKTELYIFAPTKTSNMGGQLYTVLQNNTCGMTFNELDNTYSMGTQGSYIPDKKKDDDGLFITHEPSDERRKAKDFENNYQLNLRLPSRDFFNKEEYAETPREIGIVMHQILQNIQQKGDEKQVIAEQIRNGVLRQEQQTIIEQRMQDFWGLVAREGKSDWFNTDKYNILNEQDILLPDGSTRRPDRILVSGMHAIIIDYKFGRIEDSKHGSQVREYMHLLQQMGYTTEGYLYYVTLNKIVAI